MQPNKSRFFGILFLIVLVGAISVADSQPVRAGIVDRIQDFFAPIFQKKATTTIATSTIATAPVPLYQPALDYEKAVVEAVKKASPAVVSITVSKNVPIIEQCPGVPLQDFPPQFRDLFGSDLPQFLVPCQTGTRLQEVGGGSGFVIQGDGLILTNKHVVSDTKASYTVFTNDGKKYDATILARDPVQDLAVLKIDAQDLPTVELGDSDSLALGQSAIAIGNALGEFRNTVSVGVISGLARTVTAQGDGVSETIQGVIQTDAAINPGNSGGPLLNLRGEVIAINTAIVSGAQNIGFAIPINRAKRDIASVRASGEIQSPYLGVRYVAVTADMAKEKKLKHEYGVVLQASEDGPAVMPDSPASKAGLAAGDIILEVGGLRIDKNNSLLDTISQKSVGETATLTIERKGEEMKLNVVLERRPEDQ